MASGIFAVLDDIGALMDDVAVASKLATKKTAGILGDDLAVNAEKATGFLSSRELPVLWAITKGSFLNKVIIIPIVILLQIYWPDAIKVILVIGGIYLAFEGVEKIIEFLFHRAKKGHEVIAESTETDNEKTKIRSAISTDFILSIEIIIIALGTVLNQSLTIQIITVSIVGILATVGVYGVVALIVRMDDAGYKLIQRSDNKGLLSQTGHLLVKMLPVIIKSLGVIGTIALILVSGEIIAHNVPYFHHLFPGIPALLQQVILGLSVGLIAVGVYTVFKKVGRGNHRNCENRNQ